MAEIKDNTLWVRPGRGDLGTDIDWLLENSFADWQDLPEIEAEWEAWDDEAALSFTETWPLAEMRLGDLKNYADQGKMAPEQEVRYQELLNLVNKNQPIIERLRGVRVPASQTFKSG